MKKEETRTGRLATPDGWMGATPYYVYYVPWSDSFFSSGLKPDSGANFTGSDQAVYITTIYPSDAPGHDRDSLTRDIARFHRLHNPAVKSKKDN